MAEDYMKKWEAEEKARKAKAKKYLLALAPKIKELGYQYLVAYFDGSGDSGQVESTFMSNEDAVMDARMEGEFSGEELPASIFSGSSDGTLEDHIWALTPDGFENNEGGFGAIILDTHANTIRRNYSYRVEDSCEDDTPEL